MTDFTNNLSKERGDQVFVEEHRKSQTQQKQQQLFCWLHEANSRSSKTSHTNVIKYFLRNFVFLLRRADLEEQLKGNTKTFIQIKQFITSQRKSYHKTKNFNSGFSDLPKYFGVDKELHNPQMRSHILRKLAFVKIIPQIIPILIKESRISKENMKTYLMGLKIIRQRLRVRKFFDHFKSNQGQKSITNPFPQ